MQGLGQACAVLGHSLQSAFENAMPSAVKASVDQLVFDAFSQLGGDLVSKVVICIDSRLIDHAEALGDAVFCA